MKTAAIVLAAGGSRRLGQPKQLLLYGGKTLLRISTELAYAACPDQSLVVLGSHAKDLESEVAEGVRIVENSSWKDGLSSSIRAGLEQLDADTDAVILMLGDQPMVTSEHLSSLYHCVGPEAPICASRYADGIVGVPAAFYRSVFEDLRSLTGDRGAKELLSRTGVTSLQGPPLIDIDTWDDYKKLIDQR